MLLWWTALTGVYFKSVTLLYRISFFTFCFMYMGVYPQVSLCSTCRSQISESDPLELELQEMVSNHGFWQCNLCPLQQHPVFLIAKLSRKLHFYLKCISKIFPSNSFLKSAWIRMCNYINKTCWVHFCWFCVMVSELNMLFQIHK